jgi:hypothetical protein
MDCPRSIDNTAIERCDFCFRILLCPGAREQGSLPGQIDAGGSLRRLRVTANSPTGSAAKDPQPAQGAGLQDAGSRVVRGVCRCTRAV